MWKSSEGDTKFLYIYELVPPKYLRLKHCISTLGMKYWDLAIFIDKHEASGNHQHALVSLKSMVNEHRNYCSHEFSATS